MVISVFKKRKALVQIPLLLGLVIMAVAVPVATRLVQDSQDTRNLARDIVEYPPSPTKRPAATNTPRPPTSTPKVPTSTPRPPTNTPKPSNYTCMSLGGNCVSYGCTCGKITGGSCQGDDECCRPCPTNTPRPPTSTPTKVPTAIPTVACSGTCQYADCLTMNMKSGVGNCPQPQYCCGEKIIVPQCEIGDKYCATDNSGVWVCKSDRSGYTLIDCSAGKKCNSVTETCVLISTPTPIKIPTSTPTKVACKTVGQLCNTTQFCCFNSGLSCQGAICCLVNGRTTTSADRCCSKYAEYQSSSLICTTKPSATPTKIPTSTPTKVPTAIPTVACTGTCQYAECSTMNLKSAPGNCSGPRYCCGSEIVLPKCNVGERFCSPDKKSLYVCKSDRSGYTEAACATGRICNETSKTCVALPTATPLPKTNCLPEGSRYEEGKCCEGLVKTTTPYGYYCEKKGSCRTGETKCDDSNKFVLICDTAGYFQKNQACDGGCKNGKCEIICTTGQAKCRGDKVLEVCNESGTAFVGQSCNYKCENNKCVEILPSISPTIIPTPVTCVSGKKTCTDSKGMMECNSKGNGYNYFSCGIGCILGRCLGETIPLKEPLNPTNCINGEIKCEESEGSFYEYKCNSSGFYDQIKRCENGCYYGRCKNLEAEDCLKENERYQEDKCCPGLVKVTTPYGYYCGKPGTCTQGSTKCENNNIWKCSAGGYFEKVKNCDFGCEGNGCKVSCLPKSTKCRNEQTLQVCSDDGTTWLSRSCNYCSEGICYQSKNEAQETLAYSDAGWNGEEPLPYCYAPSAEEIGLNTCPEGYICGAQKVEDRNGLYYCEKKTVENSTVKVCVPNSSFCGQGGVLLKCSSDGNRWAAAWQCPTPRPEKGSEYNYSCKQVSTDRGQCRPPTPEEGRDTAVEIVGMTAATVASVLALPAAIANIPATMLVAGGANAAYSVANAVYSCEYYNLLTEEQREVCMRSGAYAAVNTVSFALSGAGSMGINSAITTYGGLVISGANVALGADNVIETCNNSPNPTECYMAIASLGIDLVDLGVDAYSVGQLYRSNLAMNGLHESALGQNELYDLALHGDRNAFNSLPDSLKVSVNDKLYELALEQNRIYNDLVLGGDRDTYSNYYELPVLWRREVDEIYNKQQTTPNLPSSVQLGTISQNDNLVTVYRGLWFRPFDEFSPQELIDNPQTAGFLRDLPQNQIEMAIDYMGSRGIDFNKSAISHKSNTRWSPFLGFSTDPSVAEMWAGSRGTVLVAKIPENELFDLDTLGKSLGWGGTFYTEGEVAILGALDPNKVVEIYNSPYNSYIYEKKSIIPIFN